MRLYILHIHCERSFSIVGDTSAGQPARWGLLEYAHLRLESLRAERVGCATLGQATEGVGLGLFWCFTVG